MLRKPLPGQTYGISDVPFEDEDFKARYPSLYEYLFTQKWTDGSVRQTSTLSVFTDGVSLKLVINDRDNNRSGFINAATWIECLELMEARLANDEMDWKSRSGTQSQNMKTPF